MTPTPPRPGSRRRATYSSDRMPSQTRRSDSKLSDAEASSKSFRTVARFLVVFDVVSGSLFRIRQDPVRVHHFIEFFRVSGVPVVRMIPFDENAKHAADCFLIRIRAQLEYFVIIPETGDICCYRTHLGSLLTFCHGR